MAAIDKKTLTEQDIRTKFITPTIEQAGWDLTTQLREEHRITNGRIMVRGQKVRRRPAKFADYVLQYRPNLSIAVVEAKDNTHSLGDGMQQGLEYAESLQVPFVFSSNGDGFLFRDQTAATLGGDIERELTLDELLKEFARVDAEAASVLEALKQELDSALNTREEPVS